MRKHYSVPEAVRVAIACAAEYHVLLENKNYLFLYEERTSHKVMHFETLFLPRHYMHLTGLHYTDAYRQEMHMPPESMGAVYFYKECLDKTIQPRNVVGKADRTTSLKIDALPQLIHFIRHANMTVLYGGKHPYLTCDRLAGSTKFSLGFTRDHNYYVPSTCLNEDIRNLGDHPSRILAIMYKEVCEPIYRDICYVARGVRLDELRLPSEIIPRVSLENYRP